MLTVFLLTFIFVVCVTDLVQKQLLFRLLAPASGKDQATYLHLALKSQN
jgi:hypothetical protein